jgi:hypothetical protein
MRRFFALLMLLIPLPASAWEFTPDPVCTLSNENSAARVVITYTPENGLYALSLTRRSGAWQASPRFGIAFSGGIGLTIGTARHQIDGARLTVTDRGFGNVLNGLEINSLARAFTDSQSLDIPLVGAPGPVRAFRACTETPPPTS